MKDGIYPSEWTAREHENVTLTCNSNNPLWKVPNKSTLSYIRQLNSTTLLLNDVNKHYEGIYTCVSYTREMHPWNIVPGYSEGSFQKPRVAFRAYSYLMVICKCPPWYKNILGI